MESNFKTLKRPHKRTLVTSASVEKNVPRYICTWVDTKPSEPHWPDSGVMRWDLRPDDWHKHWPEMINHPCALLFAPKHPNREGPRAFKDWVDSWPSGFDWRASLPEHLHASILEALGSKSEERISQSINRAETEVANANIVQSVVLTGKTVHQVIREGRSRLKLTQQQFAEAIGVTYSAVQQWENDGGTAPKRMHQPAVADLLGISVAELMGYDGRQVIPVTGTNATDFALNVLQEQLVDMPDADREAFSRKLAAFVLAPDSPMLLAMLKLSLQPDN